MLHRKWIVVADASRARVFALPTTQAANYMNLLTLDKELSHPASRLHTSDLASDDVGSNLAHNASRAGVGKVPATMAQRSAGEPKMTPHDHEADEFAHEIVNYLDAGRTGNKFDQLVVVAPPAFLGRLRQIMPAALAKMIFKTVDKDLTFVPAHEMPERLAKIGME